jgi:2-polyprenyl-3-methyl-5-hydroxy-6-metoxy-1,4-benzoquinol methylase
MLFSAIDLSLRACPLTLPELMDAPCSYEDFRACIRDIEKLNKLTFASRPTLRWLNQIVEALPQTEPLRILDIGCGAGDMLRCIERWARKRGVAVQLTGIDLNPHATRAAREFTHTDSTIQWLTGDVLAYAEPVDIVVSSLFMHHLSETEIVRFLAWMELTARCGWFISDLTRERVPYRFIGAFTAAARFHRFVRYDAPVSIRRSFREADWTRMLAASGMASDQTQLTRWTPARLCVGRTREAASFA